MTADLMAEHQRQFDFQIGFAKKLHRFIKMFFHRSKEYTFEIYFTQTQFLFRARFINNYIIKANTKGTSFRMFEMGHIFLHVSNVVDDKIYNI